MSSTSENESSLAQELNGEKVVEDLQNQLLKTSLYSQLLTSAALFASHAPKEEIFNTRNTIRSEISQQLCRIFNVQSLTENAKQTSRDTMLFTLSAASQLVGEMLHRPMKMGDFKEDDVRDFCRVSAVEINSERKLCALYVPTVSTKAQTFFHEWNLYQKGVGEHPEVFVDGEKGCTFVYVVPRGERDKVQAVIIEEWGEIPQSVRIEEIPASAKDLGKLSEKFLDLLGLPQPQKEAAVPTQSVSNVALPKAQEIPKAPPEFEGPRIRRELRGTQRLPMVDMPAGKSPKAKLAEYWNEYAFTWVPTADTPRELFAYFKQNPALLIPLYRQLARMQKNDLEAFRGDNFKFPKGAVNEFLLHTWYQANRADGTLLTEQETTDMYFRFYPNLPTRVDEFGDQYMVGISRPDGLLLRMVGQEPRITATLETTMATQLKHNKLVAKIYATGHTALSHPECYLKGNATHLTFLVPKNATQLDNLQKELASLESKGLHGKKASKNGIDQRFVFEINNEAIQKEGFPAGQFKTVIVTIEQVDVYPQEIAAFTMDFYRNYRPPLTDGSYGMTLQELAKK